MCTCPFLTRWVLTGIVLPKDMYGTIVWANKATNYKKHLDRVQRLGLLAMAHICCSTPTAGLEAILDVMLLDLFAQCEAVQVVLRVQGRNQSSWDSISCSHLRGHLWVDKTFKGVELKTKRNKGPLLWQMEEELDLPFDMLPDWVLVGGPRYPGWYPGLPGLSDPWPGLASHNRA